MRHGLVVGRAGDRAVAGSLVIASGSIGETGCPEMVCELFRLLRNDRGEPLFERLADALVQRPPPRTQQAVIGGIAHQRVLEAVARLERLSLREHDLAL